MSSPCGIWGMSAPTSVADQSTVDGRLKPTATSKYLTSTPRVLARDLRAGQLGFEPVLILLAGRRGSIVRLGMMLLVLVCLGMLGIARRSAMLILDARKKEVLYLQEEVCVARSHFLPSGALVCPVRDTELSWWSVILVKRRLTSVLVLRTRTSI